MNGDEWVYIARKLYVILRRLLKKGSIRKGKAPWGHPVQTAMEIAATLSETKLLRIRRSCAGHERMANEAMIAGCHAESKALFISRKAAHTFSSSNASSTNYTSE